MVQLDYATIRLETTEEGQRLFFEGEVLDFPEGPQCNAAKERERFIARSFEDGFLDNVLDEIKQNGLTIPLSAQDKCLLSTIAAQVDANKGRALIGLVSLLLAIKAICPEQCIRLHKGNSGGRFSWVDGIAMRSLDSKYNVPFLRRNDLCMLNKDGSFMTRTLAENYPYTKLYKAAVEGPKQEWLELVDRIESNKVDPKAALGYFYSILLNQSKTFKISCTNALEIIPRLHGVTMSEAERGLKRLLSSTTHPARLFEIAIHSFMQALQDTGYADFNLEPLSQMRSANKKHGNVGDIELKQGQDIRESWDAKLGKPYLAEELKELADKLRTSPRVITAGFICDNQPVVDDDITHLAETIEFDFDTEIKVLSLHDWLSYQVAINHVENEDCLAYAWMVAFVESLAGNRRNRARIDEPCGAWVDDTTKMLRRSFT